jgi:hypothetical protein
LNWSYKENLHETGIIISSFFFFLFSSLLFGSQANAHSLLLSSYMQLELEWHARSNEANATTSSEDEWRAG